MLIFFWFRTQKEEAKTEMQKKLIQKLIHDHNNVRELFTPFGFGLRRGSEHRTSANLYQGK